MIAASGSEWDGSLQNWTSTDEARDSVRALTADVRAAIHQKSGSMTDAEVRDLIEGQVLQNPATRLRSYVEKDLLVQNIFLSTRRELGILQPLADDPAVNEIMVNGPDRVFVERNGRISTWPHRFGSREDLEEMIRRLAGRVHKEINELHPIVDARLADGSRIHAVYRNVAIDGPSLSIRKFPEKKIGMEELIEWGTLSRKAAIDLEVWVRSGYNIFVSGGTSSGKTTFLNVLSNFIPKSERIILVEDAAELQIDNVPNLVRLETRQPNAQGKGEVTMRQLIRASLRMRPDRIIVGEVRGEEILDMVQAMNTGHDGSLSTGHGNSPEGMLSRMEAMYLTAVQYPIESVRTQIAEAIDLIVHMGRLRDNSRKVLEIVEVTGCVNGRFAINPLYTFKREEGLVPTGNPLQRTSKLERSVTLEAD